MNVVLPAMGEGIIEATVNKWLVKEGSAVKEDDPIVEVATDKVDSEVPSPASGTIVRLIAVEGTVAKVGDIIAVIENNDTPSDDDLVKIDREVNRVRETVEETRKEKNETTSVSRLMKSRTPSGKFISPLVRSIAASEGISYTDLDLISGTGMDGRITKDDILKLLAERKIPEKTAEIKTLPDEKQEKRYIQSAGSGDEIIPKLHRVQILYRPQNDYQMSLVVQLICCHSLHHLHLFYFDSLFLQKLFCQHNLQRKASFCNAHETLVLK